MPHRISAGRGIAAALFSIVLLPCIISAAWAAPNPVDVTVNASAAVRTVDDRVFGVNTAAWDGDMDSSTVQGLLTAAGIRALRYPGGSWSDGTYLWNELGWDGEPMTPTFGALAGQLSASCFITGDYGAGTPQSNAAWVAYCNGSPSSTQIIGVDSNGNNWQTVGYWASLRAAAPLATDDGFNFLRASHPAPYEFKYWEIGNECYGGWENDTHPLPHDPVTYANFTMQAISAMKAVDPTIKIGVVVTESEDDFANYPSEVVVNPVTGVSHSGWTAVLCSTLTSLGVVPDFVIYHNYAQNPGSESDAFLLQYAPTWTGTATAIRTILNDYFGATTATPIQLCCTENNSVSYDPGKQTTSLVNGLYYADSVGSILQTEFDSLIWWDLHNGPDPNENNSSSLYGWREYGDYGILASAADLPGAAQDEPYPTYFAINLLEFFARNGDTIVPATSSYSDLSAYACLQQSGNLSLLLIDKDPANALNLSVSLAGFVPSGSGTVYQYGETQDTEQSEGQTVDIAQSPLSNAASSMAIDVPSYSMTVVSLSPLAAPPRPQDRRNRLSQQR